MTSQPHFSGRAAAALLTLSLVLAASPARAGDRDGDGVPNSSDLCPADLEDVDGYKDDDGCPDPSTRVNLLFVDDDGRTVVNVDSTLTGEGGRGAGHGNLQVDVHPGPYALTTQAIGFKPHSEQIQVPAEGRFDLVVRLQRRIGRVTVQVVDPDGRPIPSATLAFDGEPLRGLPQEGMRLTPGAHPLRVQAPGFVHDLRTIEVETDGSSILVVTLQHLVLDGDHDGIADEQDPCPEQAEDLDGYRDDDGCPEPFIPVVFLLTDDLGRPVSGLEARVTGEGGHGAGDDRFTLQLQGGAYQVSAIAPGFEPLDQAVEIPDGVTRHQVHLKLARIWTTLILYVMDDDGQPIDSFTWSLDDDGERTLGDGNGLYAGKMDPGRHWLTVYADGHWPAKAAVSLDPGTFAETSITLYRTRISVTPDKIEIADKIYFDTAKATIKPESFGLLDQVAAVLAAREDMARVRIEGHTDSRGAAAFNLQLSDDRAASVRQYLVDKGVAPDRLVSVGYGEDRPVDPSDNEEAWEKNRRVEFIIEAWREVKVLREIEPRAAEVEVKTTTVRPPLWTGFGVLDGTPPPEHQRILERDGGP